MKNMRLSINLFLLWKLFFIFIIYSTLEELLQSLTVLTIFSQICIKCHFNILNMLPYNMIIYTLIIDVVGLILLIKVYQTVKYEETLWLWSWVTIKFWFVNGIDLKYQKSIKLFLPFYIAGEKPDHELLHDSFCFHADCIADGVLYMWRIKW